MSSVVIRCADPECPNQNDEDPLGHMCIVCKKASAQWTCDVCDRFCCDECMNLVDGLIECSHCCY